MFAQSFAREVELSGADVVLVKITKGARCSCVTEEGYRDPEWHFENPEAGVCGIDGYLNWTVERIEFKAFVQPAKYLEKDTIKLLFGELVLDDHILNAPASIDLSNLRSGDYIEAFGKHFSVIAVEPQSVGNEIVHTVAALRRCL
jgi:hypothetical protein